MRNNNVKRLVVCSLFTAIGVVLSGPLTLPSFSLGVYAVNIGIGVLPVLLVGMIYGPLYGGIVGGLVDLLQVLLFPKGAFVPWFTLVAVLLGVIVGLFFKGRHAQSQANDATDEPAHSPAALQAYPLWRVFAAVGIGRVITSVILNTLLIVVLYNVPVAVLLPVRLVNQLIEVPVLTLLCWWLMPLLHKRVL